MAYRSSTVRYATDHCPRAIDHHEAGTPRDREVFAVGVAAHAILDALSQRQNALGRELRDEEATEFARAAAEYMLQHGREFDGVPEAPMASDDMAEGLRLGLRAWAAYPTTLQDRTEATLAIDAEGRPVEYSSPSAWWKAACDIVGPVLGDDDGDSDEYAPMQGVCVTDYKSAWPTNEAELDTIQLRGQALVALAHAASIGVEQPGFVRRRVINLRTLAIWEADLVLDDAAPATLDRWLADLRLAVAASEARDSTGARVARVGIGCLGCPFVGHCEPARAYLRDGALDGGREMIATRLAVVEAMRDELLSALREATKESPIAIEGGVVGYVAVPKREVKPEAATALALEWFRPAVASEWLANNGQLIGLLTALDFGVTALGNVAAQLWRADRSRANKEAREAFVSSLTTTKPSVKFGLHAHKEPTE